MRQGKLFLLTFLLIILYSQVNSQTVFWNEDFNNGCSSNCNASSYIGTNGTWTVTDVTSPGSVANQWFVSCAENGEITGGCGAGCGNNATLHIANVACGLCLVCPNGDCGAAYNAGPSFGGQNPKANKRAESPIINCSGKSNITIGFKYIGKGQNCNTDYCNLEYSADSGLTWNILQSCLTSTICGSGQGRWTLFTATLPAIVNNNPTVKIGFRWANNSDGVGQDPSFAVDSISLSVPSIQVPVSDFIVSQSTICDSVCIDFTDISTNSPSSWQWSFPGGSPSSSSIQNPIGICYNSPGVYDVTLVSTNAGGSDSITKSGFITVTLCAVPTIAFSSDDSSFCGEHCFNFFDLSTNSPSSWAWSFPGAVPDTSNDQNPQQVCYYQAGAYTVSLIASNINGNGSASYNSFINIYNNPPSPVLNINGDTLISSTAYAYQWFFNSQLIPGATNQTYIPDSTGYYNVVISDVSGCTATSVLIYFSPTGFTDFFENGSILIHPNPVKEVLKITTNLNKPTSFQICITDMLGRLVKKVVPNPLINLSTTIIDVSELSSGNYIVEINTGNYKLTRKILKD